LTSRPLSADGASAPAAPSRPHLPPVQSSTDSRRRRKAPLAWLPWLLLGLLVLTLLAAALLARAAGGGPAAERATVGAQPAAASGAPLSAGGTDLLNAPGGRLGALTGERAAGTARVESVVADEGFWVGTDATRRVFVLLTPQARRSAGESAFQVQPGQTVSLEGTVKASSPEFAQAAGVTDAEGARLLVTQGGYVEATEVRLAP
jgi:hypothetical protein